MLGGSPRQAAHAVALAQQGTLGLVCDPLGGLSSCPAFSESDRCGDRVAAIEMALAGIEFVIPADEVIDMMGETDGIWMCDIEKGGGGSRRRQLAAAGERTIGADQARYIGGADLA